MVCALRLPPNASTFGLKDSIAVQRDWKEYWARLLIDGRIYGPSCAGDAMLYYL